MNEFLWQLLRAVDKRRRVDSPEHYKFWSRHVDYLVTMCKQNGASEHMIGCAMEGDWVGLTRAVGGEA